jgi:3-methylcrotonyl-CoA carboxylase alpha subunit
MIGHFSVPPSPGVRVDSGVENGDEITQFYDPMIAKIIAYGEDRSAARARLQQALAQTVVLGVTTNLALLQAIVAHPAYGAGQTYTSFLDETALLEQSGSAIAVDTLKYALQAAVLFDLIARPANGQRAQSYNPWQTLGAWRTIGEARTTSYSYGEQSYRVALIPAQAGAWQIQINDLPAESVTFTFWQEGLLLVRQGQQQRRATVLHQSNATLVSIEGLVLRLERRLPPDVDRTAHASAGGSVQKALTAPMAGTIVKVQVQDGDEVEQRQVLVILTAMKMEHTIAAPHAGKIKRVHCKEGEVVKGGAILVEMA